MFAGLLDRDVLRRSNSSSIPPLPPANAAAPALDANADWFRAGDSQGDDRLLLDAPTDMADQTEKKTIKLKTMKQNVTSIKYN